MPADPLTALPAEPPPTTIVSNSSPGMSDSLAGEDGPVPDATADLASFLTTSPTPYHAVAEVLAYVYRLRERRSGRAS